MTPTPEIPDELRRRHQLYQVERFLRKELRRFDLRHREQTIADVILQTSYGFGKTSIHIPKLDIFVELTGITRGNVHTALKNLHSMDILSIDTSKNNPVYTINPNPNTWKCRERVTRSNVRRAIEYLKMANDIREPIDTTLARTITSIQRDTSHSEATDGGGASETTGPVEDPDFLPGIVPNEEIVFPETKKFPDLS